MDMAKTQTADIAEPTYILTTDPKWHAVKAETRRLMALRAEAVARQDWPEMNRLTFALAELPTPKVGR